MKSALRIRKGGTKDGRSEPSCKRHGRFCFSSYYIEGMCKTSRWTSRGVGFPSKITFSFHFDSTTYVFIYLELPSYRLFSIHMMKIVSKFHEKYYKYIVFFFFLFLHRKRKTHSLNTLLNTHFFWILLKMLKFCRCLILFKNSLSWFYQVCVKRRVFLWFY